MARSCGTCRDRRILCDRAAPTCTQCARSNRVCKGYGIRLSWPKSNDGRRALVGRAAHGRRAARQLASSTVVNVSNFDIKLHYMLSHGFASDYSSLSLKVPVPFTTLTYTDTDAQMLEYCKYLESTASKSLAILGHDPKDLGRILLRMALINNSPSSTAVLRGLLAISSIHRYGLQGQGFELKISAIKALGEASRSTIGAAEALQHVAAGMLLCSFEIYKASCTSSQWWCYVTGVKQVLNASCWLHFREDDTFSALLDWVFYHETLGRFSLLHWRPTLHIEEAPRSAVCSGVEKLLPSTSNTLLWLLKQGCYHLATSTDLAASIEPLRSLAREIQKTPLPDDSDPTLELFQLSVLVYLNRMTNSTLEPAITTQARIQRAFTILETLKYCPRQLPLFILGCEARTDEERCIILELIDRTEDSASSRSTFIVKALTKAVWVQDDLAGERELDYREKMDVIVSVCSLLPTFV
ncbi:fungal-specific transcription factor domain-containing protein [Aspergillus keveii]|uniref:Fungal-specific transcription factor domain-containing protein n=1 Tax=Aspergillus keveii TaxID=714993 RepID=A0ABR4FUH5_9EURO